MVVAIKSANDYKYTGAMKTPMVRTFYALPLYLGLGRFGVNIRDMAEIPPESMFGRMALNTLQQGNYFFNAGNFQEAVRMFDKTLEIKAANGDPDIEAELYNIRTEAFNSKILALWILEQGITIADIIWWNGLSEQAKTDIKNSQYAACLSATKIFLDQGLLMEDAFRKLFKTLAQFCDYPLEDSLIKELEAQGFSKEDFYLPWQLQDRCTKFIFQCAASDSGQKWFKETAGEFSTVNAFFRAQIRKGRI